MTTLIEALNFRCLRYVARPLNRFPVLAGPNASGKTTHQDVIGFMQDLVTRGLNEALESRSNNPQELLFRRGGDRLELAVEARIPHRLRKLAARQDLDTARCEAAIGFDATDRQFEFKAEKLLLKKAAMPETGRRSSFPAYLNSPNTLVPPRGSRGVDAKPLRPARAFRAALRAANKSRSSSHNLQLPQRVSTRRCGDPAFQEFRNILQRWFPPGA